MGKYKALLLDLDDTLFDFRAAEQAGLRTLFCELGIAQAGSAAELYKEINRNLWREFELGRISRGEVLGTRFGRLFEKIGLAADGLRAEARYRELLNESAQLIDGAAGLCASLSRDFELYTVTNGVSSTQRRRLERSGLDKYMSGIFISGDLGCQKPSEQFFDLVFCRIPHIKRSEALIVGDSLTSDIAGGINAGIDSCWFNPAGAPNGSPFIPTYEIASLRELENLVLSGGSKSE